MHAARLSTMAQGFGYLIAAAGPALVGVLHAATGDWTLALAVLFVLLLPQVWAGTVATRPASRGTSDRKDP